MTATEATSRVSPAREALAGTVRRICLDAAMQAYEQAGIRGLCAEGRWEAAVSALESLTPAEMCRTPPAATGRAPEKEEGPRGPEAWLSGPVVGVPTTLGPAAHALLDALAEVERAVAGLSPTDLQARPGGVASIEFHVHHSAGAIHRLLAYARGEALSASQREALDSEQKPRTPAPQAEELVAELRAAVEEALSEYRASGESSLETPRRVGRAGLPSTVRGLLYHAAEHTRRHSGQVVTTAGILRERPEN